MPAFRGHFSVQGSAVGGLSYKVKKNVPQLILAPSAIAIIFVCLVFQRFFPFSSLTVRKCETKIRVPVVSDRIPLILFLANT